MPSTRFSFVSLHGIVALSLLLQSASGFLIVGYPLVTSRVDPIVNSGAVSGHVHTIVGGSGFSQTYNVNTYTNAKCTTVNATPDKSNYWMPAPYGVNANGTFSLLPVSEVRIYYFGNDKSPVKPFPKGLRMISGNAMSQADSEGPETGWTCQGTGSVQGDYKGFPPGKCTHFLRATIRFPDCWNGRDLDSADHKSHMAFSRDHVCPSTHPVIVPKIFAEFGFVSGDYDGSKGQLVLANGDATGKSIHGDFAEGWNREVLAKAMADPTCLGRQNSFGDAAQCETLVPYFQSTSSCTYQKNIVRESIGLTGPVSALPGCNKVWKEGQSKPTCNPNPSTPSFGSATGFVKLVPEIWGGNRMWADVSVPYFSSGRRWHRALRGAL